MEVGRLDRSEQTTPPLSLLPDGDALVPLGVGQVDLLGSLSRVRHALPSGTHVIGVCYPLVHPLVVDAPGPGATCEELTSDFLRNACSGYGT